MPVPPSTTPSSIETIWLSTAGESTRRCHVRGSRRPWIRCTRCGCTITPPFAIAWYIDAICIAVTPMPWPIGIVPIEDVVQSRPGSTMPLASPGKCSAVYRPNP